MRNTAILLIRVFFSTFQFFGFYVAGLRSRSTDVFLLGTWARLGFFDDSGFGKGCLFADGLSTFRLHARSEAAAPSIYGRRNAERASSVTSDPSVSTAARDS